MNQKISVASAEASVKAGMGQIGGNDNHTFSVNCGKSTEKCDINDVLWLTKK